MTNLDLVQGSCDDWLRTSKVTSGSFHVEKETGEKAIVVLSLNEACTISSVCDGVRRDASPKVGAISILPPGSRYSQTILGTASALVFEIPWSMFKAWIEEENCAPSGHAALKYRVCVQDDALANSLFSLAAVEHAVYAKEEAMHSVLSRILGYHSNTSDAEESRRSLGGLTPLKLKRVKDLIEERMGANLSLQELSDIAGLSKFHFIRSFKESVGTTPHRYLIDRRVERALEKLLDQRSDTKSIVDDLGFCNVSHLTMTMRRRFGINPSQFRQIVFPQRCVMTGEA